MKTTFIFKALTVSFLVHSGAQARCFTNYYWNLFHLLFESMMLHSWLECFYYWKVPQRTVLLWALWLLSQETWTPRPGGWAGEEYGTWSKALLSILVRIFSLTQKILTKVLAFCFFPRDIESFIFVHSWAWCLFIVHFVRETPLFQKYL